MRTKRPVTRWRGLQCRPSRDPMGGGCFMAREEWEDVREIVAAVLRSVPPTPTAAQGPVYVAARRGGIKLWETWGEAAPWELGLRATLQDPPPPRRDDDAPDAFEVCLTQLPQPLDPQRRTAALSNAHRGVKGM